MTNYRIDRTSPLTERTREAKAKRRAVLDGVRRRRAEIARRLRQAHRLRARKGVL